MSKQIIVNLIFVFLFQVVFSFSSVAEKKKNNVNPQGKYEKLFKDKSCITVSSDFMTLHKVNGKLYAEIPLRLLGKEMLLSSTAAKTSEVMAGIPGYTPSSLYLCFTLQDSTVQIRLLSDLVTTNAESPKVARLMAENYGRPIWMGFNVLAYNADSTAVVCDITKLFQSNIPELTPVIKRFGKYDIFGTFVESLAQLGEIRAFENNIMVTSNLSYQVDAIFVLFPFFQQKPVDMEVVRTLILLPDQTMEPRLADPRIGVFSSEKINIPEEGGTMNSYSLAHRWRLEPKDEAAFRQGKETEPIKPIVMYVDNNFPDDWKEAVQRGILKWNRLFERIGFKNAIQVMDFPSNDPTFNPDNIAYSCVRYVAHENETAKTISWTDPRSGEILHSTICLFHGLRNRILIDRFLQTATIDPRIRTGELTDEIWTESLEQYVSHEMGHALGLQDNMCASRAYSVDSLRSASFTGVHGISASIMDELGFNYVAQPNDHGVKLTADLGPYDEFAIQWLYSPLLEVPSVKGKKDILSSWLDQKSENPIYRYGRVFCRNEYDPSCLSGDLGDDAIKAGNYALSNLKEIMLHMNEWIQNDPDGRLRSLLYQELVFYHEKLLDYAVKNIGGAYINVSQENTGMNTYDIIPREIQEASMHWVLSQFRDSEWLENLQLMALGNFGTPPHWRVRKRFLSAPMLREDYVCLFSDLSDNPYSLKDFAEDMYEEVWKRTIENKPLTAIDRYIQKEWLGASEYRIRVMGGNGLSRSFALSALAGEVPEKMIYERENFNSLVFLGQISGELAKINVKHMNNSHMYFFKVMKECKQMLEKRIHDSVEADRAHYRAMLYCVRALLKEKK